MTYVTLTDDQINKLCSHLLGTTESIDTGIELALQIEVTEEELSKETLNKLDEQIFCCVQCGWWCACEEESEIESSPSNLVCRECGGDDDKENGDE